MYEDGTFKFDGEFTTVKGPLNYQFIRNVKGSMGELTLNIGDISQYEEWSYMTEEGVNVTLALGPNRSLVIADFEDCLVTVVVLAGTETPPDDIFFHGPLDGKTLEALAGSFDFSVLSPVKPVVH